MAEKDKKPKDKEVQSTGYEKRSKEFQDNLLSREEIYELVKETLEKATEKAFKDKGIKKVEGHQGEYGDGTKYGFGATEGMYNATFSNKVKTMIEKTVTYGSKRIANQVYINFDAKSQMLRVYYDGTEGALFRGHMNNDDPMGYMINDKLIISTSDKNLLKKEIKKFMENASNKEVNYLLTTKLGVDDKMTTSTDSSIVEGKNKKIMKLSNLMESSGEDITNYFQGKINESLDKFSDAVKATNSTPDPKTGKDILFDDLEEETEELKKLNKIDIDDLEDFEFSANKEDSEEEIEEVTSSGSAGAFNTKFAFKKGGDFDKEMKGESKDSYEERVPMNKGGWPPKGMEKNYVQGKHDLNEQKEITKNILKTDFKVDTVKKKFFTEEENKELGINKRYLITDKLNESQQYDKWKKLSTFNSNETIHKAEEVFTEEQFALLKECACQDEYVDKDLYLDRDSAEDEMNDTFEDYNEENLIDIEKPNSFIVLKVKQEDLMNENKKFIYDYNTKNYVLNPSLNSLFENKKEVKFDDEGKLMLTKEEDDVYGKLMGDFLEAGYDEDEAEKETIKDMKKKYPRLKNLISKKTKISLKTY